MLISLSSYSQNPDIDNAGKELIKFEKNFYIGAVTNLVLAPIFYALGAAIPEFALPMFFIGVALSVIGTGFILESFFHVGNAGRYLLGNQLE